MQRHTTVAVIAGVLVIVALTAQAGAVAQQETPTDDPQDTATAAVAFPNQTTTGQTITVSNVTLTEPGYVSVSDGELTDTQTEGNLTGENLTADSVVGASDYLPAGTFDTVTITLFDVPGAEFGNATARLTTDQTLTATLHAETSGNQTFDFVATNGTADGPVSADGTTVADTATVTISNDTAADGTPTGATPESGPANETAAPA